MTYGEITKNRSMNLDDYFGESINLAARIIDITPAGKIFIDSKFKNQLTKKPKPLSL
jgi:class 3 adenylate cyclase